MSQEPNAQEPTTNDALSEDQLDKVAGGVLYSMGEETISFDMLNATGSAYSVPTRTSASTESSFSDPSQQYIQSTTTQMTNLQQQVASSNNTNTTYSTDLTKSGTFIPLG